MIIATTPNELCAELHNPMPVVLGPKPILLRGKVVRSEGVTGTLPGIDYNQLISDATIIFDQVA